ncbi:EpsG-like putative glucosyltransferase [Thioalkalivibrio sp. ALE21]|nr:EpsG-like putative glucosyltransferase [Thioalkalivibrio sp. ALE21]
MVFWLVYFFVVLLVGLRYGTTDYENYVEYYERFTTNSSLEAALVFRDPGFALLNYASGYFTTGAQGFFLFFAFLGISLKLFVYRKVAPYFILAVVGYILFSFTKDIGQIRNGFIGSATLFALYLLHNKNHLYWFICQTAAGSVQGVGYFGYLAPLFRYFTDTRVLWAALIVAVILSALGGVALDLSRLLFAIHENDLTSRLWRYVASPYAVPYRFFGGSMALVVVALVVALVFINQIYKASTYNRTFFPVFFWAGIVFILFRDFGIVAFRVADFLFFPILPILATSLIAQSSRASRPLMYVIFVLYGMAWYYPSIIANNAQYSVYLFR